MTLVTAASNKHHLNCNFLNSMQIWYEALEQQNLRFWDWDLRFKRSSRMIPRTDPKASIVSWGSCFRFNFTAVVPIWNWFLITVWCAKVEEVHITEKIKFARKTEVIGAFHLQTAAVALATQPQETYCMWHEQLVACYSEYRVRCMAYFGVLKVKAL